MIDFDKIGWSFLILFLVIGGIFLVEKHVEIKTLEEQKQWCESVGGYWMKSQDIFASYSCIRNYYKNITEDN